MNGLECENTRMKSGLNILPFTAFVTLAVMANLAGPSLLPKLSDPLTMMASGALVAEVALLGIWAAVGPSTVVVRLPATVGLLVLLSCAYVAGLQIHNDRMKVEGAILTIIAATLGFLSVQMPLWIMRAVSMRRITIQSSTELTRQEEWSQFGLKHLIILITGISILLVIVKSSMPDKFPNNIRIEWLPLIGLMGVLALFLASVTLPSLFLTLSKKRPWLWLAPLVATTCVGPFLVRVVLVSMIAPLDWLVDLVKMLFFFGIGASLTTSFVLGCFRLMGYRLERPDDDRKTGELESF